LHEYAEHECEETTIVSRALLEPVRRALVAIGIVILVPSGFWLTLGMIGLAPTDAVAIGSSPGLRTIGSVAVLGCLLAAIGCWEDVDKGQT
jgi:hypothetical protein